MNPDDEVCLCFHVSLRKIKGYLGRENPPVASLISECLGAGTGCQWCVPFLKHLHKCHVSGQPVDLRISPEQYAASRATFKTSGNRELAPPPDSTEAPAVEVSTPPPQPSQDSHLGKPAASPVDSEIATNRSTHGETDLLP